MHPLFTGASPQQPWGARGPPSGLFTGSPRDPPTVPGSPCLKHAFSVRLRRGRQLQGTVGKLSRAVGPQASGPSQMSPREAPQTSSGSKFKLQSLAEALLSRGNAATFPRVRRPREIPGARRAGVGLGPQSAEVGGPPGLSAQFRGPAPGARAPGGGPRGGRARSLGCLPSCVVLGQWLRTKIASS